MAFVPKEWVDKNTSGFIEGESPALDAENLNRIEAGIDNALPKSGGTMTGSLILKGEPTEDNEAANKSYVDNNIIYYSCSIDLSKISDDEEILLFNIPNFDSNKYLPNTTLRPHTGGGTFYGGQHFWYPITYNEYFAFDCDDQYDRSYVKITDVGDVYVKKIARYDDYYDDKIPLKIILIPTKNFYIEY